MYIQPLKPYTTSYKGKFNTVLLSLSLLLLSLRCSWFYTIFSKFHCPHNPKSIHEVLDLEYFIALLSPSLFDFPLFFTLYYWWFYNTLSQLQGPQLTKPYTKYQIVHSNIVHVVFFSAKDRLICDIGENKFIKWIFQPSVRSFYYSFSHRSPLLSMLEMILHQVL